MNIGNHIVLNLPIIIEEAKDCMSSIGHNPKNKMIRPNQRHVINSRGRM